MELMLILSFLFFMSLFAGVGMASMLVKQDTTDDYLVAGRGMHPALAALSAVSTWNSGYMFIGFIGFTYMMGYSVIWLGLVSTIGQVLAWVWLYKFIQEEGNERGLRSLSSLVAEKAGAPEAKLAAALSVLFLSIYAAAQLTSGGKALYVMMGWSEMVGILIGFVLVVAYCYAGGIRASIWTDAAQSCVMVIGSTILCWIAIQTVGGFSGLHAGLEAQSPTLTNLYPPDLKFGISMWAFAFFLGGLGVAGQPQVVSRVMTLGSDSDRKQAMIWFFVWQTPFILLMLIIGFASRVLFNADGFDAELGLPMMAMETMPAIGVGMILASIFAATMSTADSQVLACTAAITDDIKPEWRGDYKTTKIVTLVVATFATMISIAGLYIPGGDSVFALVVLAVYGLGGIFIPLLTIRWMGYKPDSTHSIAMMVAAFAGVIGWLLLGFGGADGIFPSVPGMGAAFAVHFILNQVRTPEVSALGRYNWPDQKKLGAIAAAILIPFCAFEVSYLIGAPDGSSESSGFYLVTVTEEIVPLASGSEYVNDEETLTLSFNTDLIESWPNGSNVVGVLVDLSFDEDETSSGPGCVIGGGPESDTIVATVRHSLLRTPDWSDAGGNTNYEGNSGIKIGYSDWNEGHYPSFFYGGYVFDIWYAIQYSLAIGNNETQLNYSKSGIRDAIDFSEEGLGDYFLDITVDAEAGGSFQCQHNDEGEQVDYEIQLITWDYDIELCSECEGWVPNVEDE
ncbi:MAG: sodium/proline symporter [Candidatus Thalassarchaeaceae archaeon]|jgi:sodium/proline symporter|nr:sodium/proline symporter [Candidatus Thalassarchaeaceae archaeon]